MLILRRLTRTIVALTLVMDFFIFGTVAETITSYSGRYTADLEQKQALLESIREDACKTESALQNSVNKIEVNSSSQYGDEVSN